MNKYQGRLAISLVALFATSVAALKAAHPIEPIEPAPDTGRQPLFVQPPAEPTLGTEVPTHSFVDYRRLSAPEMRETYDGKYMAMPESPRRWQFILGLTAGAYYDDNIFLTNDHEEEDFVFTIAPTIGFLFGDPSRNTVSLLYTPTFLFFADNDGENTIEHALDLNFTKRTDRYRLSFNGGYRDLAGADRQLGERTDRRLWTAGARIDYSVSDKTSIEFALGMNYVDYERFFDTLDLIALLYADYMVTGKTSLGLGVGLGYAESEGGPGQVYEQVNARVRYAATSKLIFTGTGGVEFRQIEGGENQVSPVFGIGATYLPFDSMSIHLDGYRRVRPSAIFNDANYSVTGVVVSVRQRFLHRFYLTLAGGYEATEYDSIDEESAFNRDRDDHYFFLRPSVEFRIGDRTSVELSYEHRNNDSDVEEFEFTNNRVGVKVGVFF